MPPIGLLGVYPGSVPSDHHPFDAREQLCAHLKTQGIPTAIYYPIPIHMQDVYAHYPRAPGGLPVTEAVRSRVMSLPMHPYLDEATQDRVIDAIRGFNG